MAKPSPELTDLRSKHAKSLFSWWNSEHPEDKKSQGQLAKIMGKTKEVINAKLNGHRTLTLDDAKQIARYFPGVRYQYIIGVDDYRTDAEFFEHYSEVRHGEWWLLEAPDDARTEYGQCSLCGDYFYLSHRAINSFKYCPNCGARMDGETE